MNATTLCRVVTAALLFTVVCCTANAEIENFFETFSGTGDFDSIDAAFLGLDNPGWAIGGIPGSEGTVTDGGLEFISRSSLFEVGKRIVGESSYVQEIRLKDLSLDEVTDDVFGQGSVVSVRHFFTAGVRRSRVAVSLAEPGTTDPIWQLVVQPFGSEPVTAYIPRSDDILLSIQYNQRSSIFSATYEPNDGSVPIVLATALDVELSPDSIIEFVASNDGTTIDGILHSWSLVPTSEMEGDFNGSGEFDVGDIDLLSIAIRDGDESFDLNSDSAVDTDDLAFWIHDLKNTFVGDANLDGEFFQC